MRDRRTGKRGGHTHSRGHPPRVLAHGGRAGGRCLGGSSMAGYFSWKVGSRLFLNQDLYKVIHLVSSKPPVDLVLPSCLGSEQ